MALEKAYLLPHSPLLIPEIGKSNHGFLNKTIAAYEHVKNDLIASQIETIIVVSLHGLLQEDFFLLNCAPEMEISFQDFGFIPPKTIIKGDIPLADQLKTALKNELPVKSLTDAMLDYGSAIPLYLLKNSSINFKTVILLPADKLDLKEQFKIGNQLAKNLETTNKKVALIASGDLSHRLKRKSPGGYSPKGPKFDNKLIEYLSEPETAKENLLKLDPRLALEANECALKPIAVVLGALENRDFEPDILAYQTDFGIGYLSIDFQVKSQIWNQTTTNN